MMWSWERPAKRREWKLIVSGLLVYESMACLGAQVNVDMPWNPSRLEQRKGRVQRIGQIRDNVHVLNLRYAGTVEDVVYTALSNRFGDIFLVLGQLPDAFEDDWIAAIIKDRSALINFSQRVETTKPAMELRYNQDMDDRGNCPVLC
jgi:hypothetical protein